MSMPLKMPSNKKLFSVTIVFAMLIGVLISQPSFAQGPEDIPKSTTNEGQEKKVLVDSRGKRLQVIDFDDASIEGKAKAPEGFVLQSRDGASFRNILELRRNFRPQIMNSVPVGLMAAPQAN